MDESQLIKDILNENNFSHLEFNDTVKSEIIYPSIEFLNKKIEDHPEFDFNKILLISLLLVNNLKRVQIRITPRILIFTSTILWHSTILRPNNEGYFTQEEIDRKVGRSISAARYLRQELGITEKKYNSLNDFYEKLENSVPLKEQMRLDYENIPQKKYDYVRNLITEKIIGRERAKSAIECSTFLFFHNKKSYSKNEIWYAVKDNLNLEGLTPRASFNSDISRYTENAIVKNKRNPLLFTITNPLDKEYKIQFIEEIRQKINEGIKTQDKDFFHKVNDEITDNDNKLWICPMVKCNHKQIQINRNDKNQIDASTYKQIIIHFLKHLKLNNEYFGSTEIYNIFLNNLDKDVLSEEDLDYYPGYKGTSPTLVWKTQIRATLDSLRVNGLIESNDPEDIPDFFNQNIVDKRKLRIRKRSRLFFEEYEIYDDWELYNIENQGGEKSIIESLPLELKPDYSNFKESTINFELIKGVLLNKKQIILMGPPGTSKTYLAEQIALDLIQDPLNYEIVQFHPSYSYEDFVEGITTESTKETLLKFVPKKKVFRKICQKAESLQENEYFVLIIDEINRGNVEKIFGELIWGLEKRNKAIKTLYINEKLVIPENLLIIGTMNTVDLSIANIDAALRRRFNIIPIMPDNKILENWLKDKYKERFPTFQTNLIDLMDKLNEKIRQDTTYLGPYRQLGHTYFFIEPEDSIEKLREKMDIEWKFSIKPLLLEYFNFNEEKLADYEEIYNHFKENF